MSLSLLFAFATTVGSDVGRRFGPGSDRPASVRFDHRVLPDRLGESIAPPLRTVFLEMVTLRVNAERFSATGTYGRLVGHVSNKQRPICAPSSYNPGITPDECASRRNLVGHQIRVLNVAGNVRPKSRKSLAWGIEEYAVDFLCRAFRALGHEEVVTPLSFES